MPLLSPSLSVLFPALPHALGLTVIVQRHSVQREERQLGLNVNKHLSPFAHNDLPFTSLPASVRPNRARVGIRSGAQLEQEMSSTHNPCTVTVNQFPSLRNLCKRVAPS